MNDNGHRRTASALRSELPPGIPKPAHKRQVSWGLENNTEMAFDPNDNLQQPELHPSSTAEPPPPPPPPASNFSSTQLPYFHPNRGGSGRISAEDLRSTRPMESEAEHYLLKALETRDPTNPRKNSESSTTAPAVLSNITPEDMNALHVTGENAASTDTADNASLGSTHSQRSSRSSSRRTTPRNATDDSNTTTISRPSTLRRDKSTRSGLGGAPMRHRRTETVWSCMLMVLHAGCESLLERKTTLVYNESHRFGCL